MLYFVQPLHKFCTILSEEKTGRHGVCPPGSGDGRGLGVAGGVADEEDGSRFGKEDRPG